MNDAFFMRAAVKKQAMKTKRKSCCLNFIGEIDKVAVGKSKGIANASGSIEVAGGRVFVRAAN